MVAYLYDVNQKQDHTNNQNCNDRLPQNKFVLFYTHTMDNKHFKSSVMRTFIGFHIIQNGFSITQ
jgi:hypothetical protein